MTPSSQHKVPEINDLCDQLGFTSLHRAQREFVKYLEDRTDHNVTSGGQPIGDLVEWKDESRHQLWEAAAEFLAIHGGNFWHATGHRSLRQTLVYPDHQDRYGRMNHDNLKTGYF